MPNSRLLGALVSFVLLGVSSPGGWSQAGQSPTRQAPPGAKPPAEFLSLSRQAMDALEADKLQDAIPLFRRALALSPGWAEGWWSLGTAYYDQEDYERASQAFERVVKLDPSHGTAHAMLGLCQFQLGQEEQALRNIEAGKNLGIIEDQQLRQTVLYHEGVLLQRAGRFEAAKTALTQLCLNGATNDEVRLAFGKAVLRMRDANPPAPGSDAVDVLNHVGRGACLSAQKNYDAAKPEFELAASKYPHFPHIHEAYGEFLIDARDTDAAIAEFQRAIDDSPASIQPRLRICSVQYKRDSAAALPYAKEAVRLAPQVPFTHYMYGLLLLDTGDYRKSIPELEIARKGFPKESRIAFALGSAYSHEGRTSDAAKARAEFVRLKAAEKQSSEGTAGESPDLAPEIPPGTDAAPGH